MAALYYIISVESNVFVPSYSGHMACAVTMVSRLEEDEQIIYFFFINFL
jgi:hypothetical protein